MNALASDDMVLIKNGKKGGWIMNKHQFNVEIQYSQHTHPYQKHRHFLQLSFISFGVCVLVFYSILTIWQICVRSVMQQQTQWDIHFFLKKGNVIIRKCIEFVNKKGWTWRAREEQKKMSQVENKRAIKIMTWIM